MAQISDFILHPGQVPAFLQDLARDMVPGGERPVFGRSKTFGYFLLSQSQDGLRLIWSQKNRSLHAHFEKQILSENPFSSYTKTVTAQRSTKKSEDTLEFPRIYIDRGLKAAGFRPDDAIRIEINDATQTITIYRTERK